jgi:hypothetical protein
MLVRRRISGWLVLSGFAFCTQSAWAFFDPPYLTPAHPIVGEPISVSIYGGECDLVDYGINWPPPVTRQGNEITIVFTGIHEGDPEWCFYGIGTATYPVGVFPPGSYTLDVERRYADIGGEWVQETLGMIPFTVAGVSQPPAEAPTLSLTGLSVLVLGLIAATMHRLRERLA